MFVLLQVDTTNGGRGFFTDLPIWADVAQVVIAVANIALACYIFFGYQRKKDKKASEETAQLNRQNLELHRQNIRLQLYRDLLIQPGVPSMKNFYSNLRDLKQKIDRDDLDDSKKQQLMDIIKSEASELRTRFIALLGAINEIDLQEPAQKNINKLVDDLCKLITDNEEKLTHSNVYLRKVIEPLTNSEKELIKLLYKYQAFEDKKNGGHQHR